MRWSERLRLSFVAATIAVHLAATGAAGQELHAYPQRGQSPERQAKDRADCQQWASKQPGTTAMPAASPPTGPPPGDTLRSAGRGAAIGAVGGAIGGDAGKGAAIGAATGAVFGGLRRANAAAKEQEYNANVQAQNQQAQASFARAFAACLQGRGYSVQ